MKVVIVSDTHMPRMSKKLPPRLLKELRRADAIIHAGDWTAMSVYEQLAEFAPLYGVAGNNDGEELRSRLGLRKVVELAGCRIGLVHGHGAARRGSTEAHAVEAFKGTPLAALVYGHSHIPVRKLAGDTLVFNPGSPTDKRRQPLYSFGLFNIEAGSIRAKHIYYADKS
jgi:putative phosphoesterase